MHYASNLLIHRKQSPTYFILPAYTLRLMPSPKYQIGEPPRIWGFSSDADISQVFHTFLLLSVRLQKFLSMVMVVLWYAACLAYHSSSHYYWWCAWPRGRVTRDGRETFFVLEGSSEGRLREALQALLDSLAWSCFFLGARMKRGSTLASGTRHPTPRARLYCFFWYCRGLAT